MIRRFACLSLFAALVASSLAGCYSTPTPSGASVEATSSPRLEEKSPIDVAIAPVVNMSGQAVPATALRRSFQKSLVKRRYSALSLELVDTRVVDATYRPGSLQEGAVLQATVEGWDTSLWETRGAITAKIQAKLVDAIDPSQALWSGTVNRRFDFGDIHNQFRTDAERVQFATDQIARELLDALPARNAVPGALSASARP